MEQLTTGMGFTGKTVMIVDDSSIVRQALSRLFSQVGMKVVAAFDNGAEAINRIHELRPDLICLDIIMPDLHGIECYKKIKSAHPDQEVIFLSCIGADPDVAEVFKDKIDPRSFNGKPASTADLENALRKFYRMHPSAVPTHKEAIIMPEYDMESVPPVSIGKSS